MEKTLFAAAAAVMMLAAAAAADEKALSSAQEIARYDTTKSSGNAPRASAIELDRPEWRATALELAREGVVLLKNDCALPLRDETKRIALVGPNANSAWAMLGDYTYQWMQAFWHRNPREWDKPHSILLCGHKRARQMTELLPPAALLNSNCGDCGII